MRLTIILLTVGFLNVHAKGVSQNVSFSGNNVSLEKVFSVIKKQTGYFFFYNEVLLRDAKPVTIDADNIPLKDFMDKILSGQSLTYAIENKSIIVSRKAPTLDVNEALEDGFSRSSFFTPAAEPIKGVVKDSAGMPLSGATVTNKRTKKSVQTNVKGEFNIEGEEGDVLMLSYIGFENQNIKIAGASVFVVMRTSMSPLDEIQIKAYGTTSKRLNTGSITTIKGEDIAKQPVNNPLLALQGRVPNLIITPQSGRPGAGVNLQLRGQNSLARSNGALVITQPLIVVDGVPYTNNISGFGFFSPTDGTFEKVSALSFINPTDIESIEVLADADATSIYGSRGGNGVILITTKKGKAGVTRVNISASVGSSDIAKKLDMMNTQEYLAMRKEAYKNDLLMTPDHSIIAEEKNNTNYDLTLWDQNRYTDWQETFLGGHSQDYNATASITGGTSTVQYLISGTYANQGSVLPGNYKNQSGNGHFSLTGTSANGKLSTNLTASYNSSIRSNPSTDILTSFAILLAPNAPAIYKPNGELNWEPDPRTGMATWQNPYAQLLRGTDERTNTIGTSSTVSYRFTDNLQVKTTVGFNKVDYNSIFLLPIASMDPADVNNRGSANYNVNSSRQWTFDPQIFYNKRISAGNLETLIGFSLQNQNLESQYIYTYGYTDDALLKNLAIAPAGSVFLSNNTSEYKYAAIFGRLSYNWQNKYLINLNVRRDGSSRFGPGEQFGNFWSVGGAWIFSDETLIKDQLSFLSFAKLRGSYGSAGNDGIGDYSYLELYQALGSGLQYQGATPIKTQGATNPYYHWEDIRKAEIALEMGLLKDRILFSAAYWQTRSSDQLGELSLPATAGAPVGLTANQPAKIQNIGWDFMLSTTNIRNRNFSWHTNANLGLTRNKLLKKPLNGNFGLDDRIKEGDPFYGIVYVNEFRGVNPVTGLYQFAKGSSTVSEVTGGNKTISIQPQYAGGFSNTFNYKRISLSAFMEFRKQKGRNYLYTFPFAQPGVFNSNGGNGNLPKSFSQRWQQQGDMSSLQRLTSASGKVFELGNAVTNSDIFWVDASYLRVNNLSLSYSLSDSWKKRMHMQDLKVFLNVLNLWTITNYKGLDPQTQIVTDLPQLRTIVIGINLVL